MSGDSGEEEVGPVTPDVVEDATDAGAPDLETGDPVVTADTDPSDLPSQDLSDLTSGDPDVSSPDLTDLAAPTDATGDADASAGPDQDASSSDAETGDAETADADAASSDADGPIEDVVPDLEDEDVAPLPVFDCATIDLEERFSPVVVEGARAWHGLTFDDLGNYIGTDPPHIYWALYGETARPLVPGLGDMEQIDRLPGGDYVVARTETQVVLRVTPEGGTIDLATDIRAYGIRVGPDFMVYAADGSDVYRIDPEEGGKEVWLRGLAGLDARVLDFSPDGTRVYVGQADWGTDGDIFYADLDADYNVIDRAELFATGLGQGWHDALGVDVCGNVYVAEYLTSAMYRVTPDGDVFRLWANGTLYGHGIAWGSGVGGWLEDAIYVPLPYNGDTVGEVQIGVPYRTWDGIVLNGP